MRDSVNTNYRFCCTQNGWSTEIEWSTYLASNVIDASVRTNNGHELGGRRYGMGMGKGLRVGIAHWDTEK